jgi:hypothetical protein
VTGRPPVRGGEIGEAPLHGCGLIGGFARLPRVAVAEVQGANDLALCAARRGDDPLQELADPTRRLEHDPALALRDFEREARCGVRKGQDEGPIVPPVLQEHA